MLCHPPAPLSVLQTATRSILLRRRGHGAPFLRLMGAGDYFFGISSATSGLCAPRRAQTRCLMAIHPLTHALRPLARLFGLRIDAAAVGQQRGAVLFAASADARLLPALAQKCAPSRRQPSVHVGLLVGGGERAPQAADSEAAASELGPSRRWPAVTLA